MYFLGGWVAGFVVIDVLHASGLTWLTWPIVGLLTAFIVVGTVINRRRARR